MTEESLEHLSSIVPRNISYARKVQLFQLDKDCCHVQLGQGEAFLGAREATIVSKARIAAQRIPKRKQFQLAIGEPGSEDG